MKKEMLETWITSHTQDFWIPKEAVSPLLQAAELLVETWQKHGRVLILESGGTVAAAHAAQLLQQCRPHGRAAFDAENLSLSGPCADWPRLLLSKARRGDLVLCFSAGDGEPCLEAARTAREIGLSFLYFSGGNHPEMNAAASVTIPLFPAAAGTQALIFTQLLTDTVLACLEDVWGMEMVHVPPYPSPIRYVLFDFDGTLSLIREGWQEVMIPYFIEVLKAAPRAESDAEIERCVVDFVDRLTGKQTIFQCIRLDEEVQKRGGAKSDPGEFKAEYLRRLGLHIKARVAALQNGADPNEYLVPGSAELLALLRARGYKLYLASGTDEADVLAEAELLGITHWFEGQIHGALENMTDCSKELVIRDMLEKNGITGDQLLSFGDGYVEIELVKQIGGYSIGVASDEVRCKGIHQRKRSKLLEAGADMIIPDFSQPEALLNCIQNGGVC